MMKTRKSKPKANDGILVNTDITQNGRVDIRQSYIKLGLGKLNPPIHIDYFLRPEKRRLDIGCIVIPLYFFGIIAFGLGLLYIVIGLHSIKTISVLLAGIFLIGLGLTVQKLAARIRLR